MNGPPFLLSVESVRDRRRLAARSEHPGKSIVYIAREFAPGQEVCHLRHVSTRGEAPAFGFSEVMLAGLARDGGLYVPDAWPRLEAETIIGFTGRPYAEVAV